MSKLITLAIIIAFISMIMTAYTTHLFKEYILTNSKMMCAWVDFATATEDTKKLCEYIKEIDYGK